MLQARLHLHPVIERARLGRGMLGLLLDFCVFGRQLQSRLCPLPFERKVRRARIRRKEQRPLFERAGMELSIEE
jgi:hypothetical protein